MNPAERLGAASKSRFALTPRRDESQMQLGGRALLPARHKRPRVEPQRGLLVRSEPGGLGQLEVDGVDRLAMTHPPADLVLDRRAHESGQRKWGMRSGSFLACRPPAGWAWVSDP